MQPGRRCSGWPWPCQWLPDPDSCEPPSASPGHSQSAASCRPESLLPNSFNCFSVWKIRLSAWLILSAFSLARRSAPRNGSRFFLHPLDFRIGRLHDASILIDWVSFRSLVLGSHMEDPVGIDVKSHFYLGNTPGAPAGMPSRWNRVIVLFPKQSDALPAIRGSPPRAGCRKLW